MHILSRATIVQRRGTQHALSSPHHRLRQLSHRKSSVRLLQSRVCGAHFARIELLEACEQAESLLALTLVPGQRFKAGFRVNGLSHRDVGLNGIPFLPHSTGSQDSDGK